MVRPLTVTNFNFRNLVKRRESVSLIVPSSAASVPLAAVKTPRTGWLLAGLGQRLISQWHRRDFFQVLHRQAAENLTTPQRVEQRGGPEIFELNRHGSTILHRFTPNINQPIRSAPAFDPRGKTLAAESFHQGRRQKRRDNDQPFIRSPAR